MSHLSGLAFGFGAFMLGVISIGAGFVRDKIVLIILRAFSGIGMYYSNAVVQHDSVTTTAIFSRLPDNPIGTRDACGAVPRPYRAVSYVDTFLA